MITREFDLMLYQEGNLLFINANQYDSGEQWIFTLYEENGVKYTPATGAIVGVKSDGKGIINTGTVDEYGRVVINETQQMTAAAGLATFELLIDNDTHGTANFKVDVEPRPADNADLSDSDLSLIQEAVDAASEIEDLLGGQDVPTVITPIISDWLDENITNPSNPPIDTSLTVAGAAADAKKTGDEITDLKSAFNSITEETNLFDPSTVQANVRLDGAGRTTSSNGYFTSDFMPVEAGWIITKNSPVIDNYHRIGVYSSASNSALIEGQLFSDNQITIVEGGAYVRICGLSTEIDTTTVTHRSVVDNVARSLAQTAINSAQSVADKLGVISVAGNQFDSSTVQANVRLDSAGRTTSGDGYFTSAFIPVSEGYTVTKNSPVENAYHRIAVYSEADGLSLIEGQVFNDNVITVAKGGKYVRICGLSTEVSTTTVIVNSAIDESARFLANVALNNIDSLDAEQTKSMLGSDGVTEYSASLSGGSSVTITTFPSYLKKNTFVSFYGKFSSFSGLLIGKGYNTYRGDWIEVTPTSVIFHHYEENTDNVVQTDTHGITISDYIMVMMYLDADGKLNCSINSTGGTFSTYRQTNYDVFSGNTFATPTATMTDVELCVSNGDTKKPVWCIGDSYFGVNEQRVVGQLKNLGFWDGMLFDGLAGLNSQNAYAELNKLLSFGLPKMLVWYLGMNDNNASYLEYMNLVKAICEDNGITLILNKVPSVPTLEKETIGGYVEASGCRYINSYLAVGSSVGGTWYTGFLSSDNVHPTALGAKALAMRMLVDVPELAEYGYNRN
jgi:uncharacterized protein YgiB involved in biofilm formation